MWENFIVNFNNDKVTSMALLFENQFVGNDKLFS